MRLLLKIAWRSLWRNWRRSLITIAAIFFAVFLMILMRGIQKGTYANNIKTAVEMFTGYLQIQKESYNDIPTLRKSYELNSELTEYFNSNQNITGYSPRIIADGLIGKDDNSYGSAIFAFNPEKEKTVSNIHKKLNDGEFLSKDKPNEIVIGYKLLNNLNLSIGDTVVILASGYDGSMGNQKFIINGTIKTGTPQFDKMAVFMNLNAADQLLSMHGKINVISIGLNDFENLQSTKNEVAGLIKDDLTVLDWKELMPEMMQTIEFDDISGLVYLGLLLLIVAFGILNTIVMSITERTKEFGIMLALGTKKSILLISIFFETIFMSLIGLTLGVVAGYFTNFYIMQNPIYLGEGSAEVYEQFGFMPELNSSVMPEVFTFTIISTLAVVLLVYIYPLIKISKLEAMKGIRYV